MGGIRDYGDFSVGSSRGMTQNQRDKEMEHEMGTGLM